MWSSQISLVPGFIDHATCKRLIGITMIAACVLAYLSRNLDPRFGEAKQMFFATHNMLFCSIFIALIASLLDFDATVATILHSFAIAWMTTATAAVFVLPRMVEIAVSKRQPARSTRRLSSFYTQSSFPLPGGTGTPPISSAAPESQQVVDMSCNDDTEKRTDKL